VSKFIYLGLILLLSLIGCAEKIEVPEQSNIDSLSIVINIDENTSINVSETQANEILIDDTVPEVKTKSVVNSWYRPKLGTSWQWQLSGIINTEYDVDMYDIDLVDTPQSTIDELHARGIKVICYFSAGSWEEFRDDADDFPKGVLGKTLDGWPDEKWLDVSEYEIFSAQPIRLSNKINPK